MITVKEIDDYLDYVAAHPTWINKLRYQLIENILKPTLAREDIYFNEKQYRDCIRFCEANYYPLFQFQKAIYAPVFFYSKEDDEPIFPNIVVMMGRGNGKDGLMVPLAHFLTTPMYGVRGYHVEIVANAEDQAKDTFDVAYNMLEEKKAKFKGKFRWGKSIIRNVETGSELKYNTSNAKTKDGKKIGCVFFNEYHAYETYDQINVFESGGGKVKHYRKIIITTNGYVRGGPLDELLDMLKEILETGVNPLGYFPFLCCLDDEKEVDNEDAWHKANPSLEYFPNLLKKIRAEYIEMQRIPSKRPEFMTKRMNMPARKEEQAIASWEEIEKACWEDVLKKRERKPNYENYIQPGIIGIDYADIRDFASAGVLTQNGEELVWRQKTWINSRSPNFKNIKFPFDNFGQDGFNDFEINESPVISIAAIVQWCIDMMKKFDIKKIAMDTYRYALFETEFQSRGISVESKDNPDGIVRLIRKIGSVGNIIIPFIETLFAEGKINLGNSAIMRWYCNNTSVKEDSNGNKSAGKIEPKLRKTDGFMAMLVAMFCKDLLKEVIIYV